MKLTSKEQAQLTPAQKMFYAYYGELPTDNIYYKLYLAKQKMYDEVNVQKELNTIADEIAADVISTIEKTLS
jgi:hypothetical protein